MAPGSRPPWPGSIATMCDALDRRARRGCSLRCDWPGDCAASAPPLPANAVAMPATSAQNARRAMILSRIPPLPDGAPSPGHRAADRHDYDAAGEIGLDRLWLAHLSGQSITPRTVLAGLGPAIHEKPLVG